MTGTERTYKSILVSREVYQKLKSLKKTGESFSDLLSSLMDQGVNDSGLRKLEGILADGGEPARVFEEALEQASKHFRWGMS